MAIAFLGGVLVLAAGFLFPTLSPVPGPSEEAVHPPAFETVACEPLRLRHAGGVPVPEDARWAVDGRMTDARLHEGGKWPLTGGGVVELVDAAYGELVRVRGPAANHWTDC